MGSACVLSRAQVGLLAPEVRVEVHVGGGLPQFGIVGLPAPVVRESKDRVRAALASAGYDFPAGRLTVNLAPAELPKEGGRFDLAIALGILLASGQVRARLPLDRVEFYGELGLGGELKRVQGLLATALRADAKGHRLIAPAANTEDLALAGVTVAGLAADLPAAVALLRGEGSFRTVAPSKQPAPAPVPDLADVRGQSTAKRALLIAAAGGHHLLFIGAPGVGKSLLAQRLPGLLPPLGLEEQREVAAIHALRGDAPARAGMRPPFRAPHHTASAYAMVGGGPRAVPGEISLAHRGVLFLDELPEFSRNVLEALREPLETGEVNVVRTAMQARYPAEFQLVAAMNPCPCGQLGQGECDCSPARLQHYRARLSGPLLDRIDLRLHVHRVGAALWKAPAVAGSETSAAMAERVRAAREIQRARQGCLNARLGVATTMSACALTPGAQRSLERGTKRFELSARVAHRMARIARTIADLEAAPVVTEAAVAEALTLRFD